GRPKGAQVDLGVSRGDRQVDDELDERIVQQLFRSASFRHPELRGELLRSLRHLVGAGDDLDLWRRVQVPHVGGADLSAADEADAQRSGVHHPKKANVLHDVETMTDLGAKNRQVLAAIEHESVPLELSSYLVRDEPVPFAEAARAEYKPFRLGDRWGPPWSTTWFHVQGRVPAEWAGQTVAAVFDIGFECRHTGFTCEALSWRDGKPWRGVDPNHSWLPITSPDVDFYLDTAWLWPVRETRRKSARTFSTALAMMDEYPDYRFACSQPAQYAWMKESYPDIFQGIREKVSAGQWEPVGSMWVEADCNLPSGEALARQFLHGKRFFMQEFGVDTRELWLPDVFGYPASLPQLIAESGGEYFLTQKLSWNDTNKPAHHTFMWEGIDGTSIFTHFPPADTYNGDFSAGEIVHSAADFKD